jgi:hypothetical protein
MPGLQNKMDKGEALHCYIQFKSIDIYIRLIVQSDRTTR